MYSRIVASDDNTIKSTSLSNGQTQTVLTGFDFDDDYSNPSDWFEQFQNADLSDGRQSFTSRFFYTRDTFTITLHSHGSVFDSSLREYDSEMDDYMVKDGKLIEPPYPNTLEENAYYFDGWYTSPECVDGTQYVEGSGKRCWLLMLRYTQN